MNLDDLVRRLREAGDEVEERNARMEAALAIEGLRKLLEESRMFVTGDLKLKCLPSENDRECYNRCRAEFIAKIDTAIRGKSE